MCTSHREFWARLRYQEALSQQGITDLSQAVLLVRVGSGSTSGLEVHLMETLGSVKESSSLLSSRPQGAQHIGLLLQCRNSSLFRFCKSQDSFFKALAADFLPPIASSDRGSRAAQRNTSISSSLQSF